MEQKALRTSQNEVQKALQDSVMELLYGRRHSLAKNKYAQKFLFIFSNEKKKKFK